MSFRTETSGTCSEQTIHIALDPDTTFLEDVPNDAPSRALARKKLMDQIVSRASHRWLEDYPWFTHVDIHQVAELPHAGDTEPTQLGHFLIKFNALAPIHILPPEVFVSALSRLIHDPKISPTQAHQYLLRASTVCVFWRHTIFSSPLLWTRVDLTQSEHAAVALKLSQMAPIHLEYNGVGQPDVHTTVFRHATRIKSLRLMMPLSSHGFLLGNFPPSFPLLHTLALRAMNIWDDRTSQRTYPLLRSSIAHSAMPSLRSLKIRGLWLPLTLPLFRGLIRLHIKLKGRLVTFPLSTFRDMLARCPELESLRLHNAGPTPCDTTPTPAISLPKLRELVLWYFDSSSASHAALVLGNVTFPPNASLRISCSMPGLPSKGLTFSSPSASASAGRLYVLNDGGDPFVLHHLPKTRTLIYHSFGQTQEVAEERLLAVLAALDLQWLQVLKTEWVSSTVLVNILSDGKIGALRKLAMNAVPWQSLDKREEEMDVLKGLVAAVKVSFVRRCRV
ncbi:hypothetical protein EVG20_g5602 [Dentipellis fragilis]|uniref:Uncharacterized protein n=1 Tax=Dentipellis fragilis TaxID=205917 RepID=A0A4Y9YUL5_9AGAM|nr:hypothetical protein EVG20_g5602 [Dentipellis fragilis]